jgi:protein-arginine deiminase
LVSGCGSSSDTPATPTARLLVDANRDGLADDTDAGLDRASWNERLGAVFLANIDDDSLRCPKTATTDDALAACNDAADEVVNGEDDALDLAPLRVVATLVPEGGTVEVAAQGAGAGRVRLFAKRGGAFVDGTTATLTLTTEEATAGIDLGLEGLDIVRDATVWDGLVELALTVKDAAGTVVASDLARMRVAPLFLSHHLLQAERTFATKFSAAMDDGSSAKFCTDMGAATQGASVTGGFTPISTDDQWAQDYFETAFTTMPGPGGTQRAMRVYIRSANYNINNAGAVNARFPLRVAGRVVFSRFRGKDVAGLQQYALGKNLDNDSYDSLGNTETIPPHNFNGRSWPMGRIMRGATGTDFPEPSFRTMLESQGFQDPVYIDTSWLLVGHVDETTSFVKGPGRLGWKLLLADTVLGKRLLTDAVAAGAGSTKMFVGMNWYDYNGNATPAETTISATLADTAVMAKSAEVAIEEEHQLQQLKDAVGLVDDDVLRIPSLDQPVEGKALAYVPGMVNGIYLSDTVFGAPEPHGPLVGGVDPFKATVEATLATAGIRVVWIEDWDLYHAEAGEVHCGSNTQRAIPSFKWWEQAR